MYICMYVSVCMYIISLPYTRNITNWCFNFVSWITFTHLISHHRSPIMRVERPLVAMSASSTMRYHVSAELKGKIYSGITLRWRHKTWRYFKICDISITFLKSLAQRTAYGGGYKRLSAPYRIGRGFIFVFWRGGSGDRASFHLWCHLLWFVFRLWTQREIEKLRRLYLYIFLDD